MRKFKVIVKKTFKKPLCYVDLSGEKALDLMISMESKGFYVAAETSANGINEILTLTEMQEIFAD